MQNEMDAHHNIERNIVKEIMRECYPKKIYPNENFVAYFVSTTHNILIKTKLQVSKQNIIMLDLLNKIQIKRYTYIH